MIPFAYRLRWFPFAALPRYSCRAGAVARLLDYASCLVLSALTIASVRCWRLAYRVRSTLVHADFVATARGRGIPGRKVIGGHVLRVALTGGSIQSAMVLVDSLCDEILVELVFARPGLGSLLWRAIQFNAVTFAADILLILTMLFTVAVVLLDITCHLWIRASGCQAWRAERLRFLRTRTCDRP